MARIVAVARPPQANEPAPRRPATFDPGNRPFTTSSNALARPDMTKFVFVTGGVVSSWARESPAALAAILESRASKSPSSSSTRTSTSTRAPCRRSSMVKCS